MKYSLLLLAFFFTFLTNSQQDKSMSNGIFEGEPYLAINPTNSKNIVIAWMHLTLTEQSIRVRSSFDGGNTWNNPIDIEQYYSNAADPTMAFNNSGILYLCYIDHNDAAKNGTIPDSGGIYSLKSSDGGLTWTNKTLILDVNEDSTHLPIDRPWLVCDRSNGAYNGNLYVTTKPANNTPAPFHGYFAKSTNGATSWDPWKYVDTIGWLSGLPSPLAAPTVRANGVFACIYPSYVQTQSPLPKYIMASSSNGGASFSYSPVIVSIPSSANDSSKQGWQMIADPANPNHMAFFFLNGTHGDLDVFMTETTNGGTNWTPATRVNDDAIGNGKLQDLFWASFDEDSDLVVCWRDRRNSPGVGYARASEIMGRVKWKDSSNFSPSFIISDSLIPYSNILSQAGNDFLCQQVHNDTLYITWGDTRTGTLNIWFDRIALRTGNTTRVINIAKLDIPFVELYPNPTNDFVNITSQESINSVKVYNEAGSFVKEYFSTQFSIDNLPKGMYYLMINTQKGTQIKKMIKN